MPGRGYNGPSNSSSSGRGSGRGGWTPGGGRGGRGAGAGRGGRGGGGRGRGGFSFTDMSTMAMDYESKVTIDDTDGNNGTASGASRSHTPAYAMSSGPPPSFKPFQVKSQPASTSSVYQPQSQQLPQAPMARPYGAPAAGHSAYNNSASSYQPYKPKHAGLGASSATPANATVIGGRRNESSYSSRYQSDPSLLKPVAFVKSSNIIKPTMDKGEHDSLLAQKQTEDALESPPTASATLSNVLNASGIVAESNENVPPPAVAETSQTMARDFSSASSKSSVLSPRAAPYERPSFLGDKRPSFQYVPETFSKGKGKKTHNVNDVLQTEDDTEAAPLFFIDTMGDRGQQDDESDSDSGRSGKMNFFADEQESDTEELYPRRVARNGQSSTGPNGSSLNTFPSLPSAVNAQTTSSSRESTEPLHLPLKPYARTISDNMPLERIFKPFIPELPPSAIEVIAHATSGATSQVRDQSRKVSKKQQKKEAKERKKERKRGKRAGRSAFKNSANEPRRPRMEDSDVEWGSDGPPAINDEDYEEDSEESGEDEIAPTATSQSHKGKMTVSSNGGKRRGRKDAAIEAAMADYAANVNNDPEEMEALRSFVKSFNDREQLSLDDLDDLAEIAASDDSNMSDQTSDDEAFEERMIMKEFVREQGKVKQGKGGEEVFPVYVPGNKELDSDPGDVGNEIWKSDDEQDEGMDGTWKAKGKKYIKENGKKRRDASESEEEEEDDEGTEEGVSKVTDGVEGLDVDTTVLIISEDDDDDEDEEEEDEDDDDDESEEDDDDIDDLDDEEIDDLLFASLKPARKKNQAPKYLSTDIFDESLQNQWRKDREKKALRRQERALKRLEGKPTKSNSKKAKRAAAKAKGFRDDDGDMMMGLTDLAMSGGRVPEFHQINQDLKDFIENSGGMEYALQPMDKKFRYAIHMIADAYNLKSKSRGNGRDRHNVLYRTQHTTVRGANMRKVQKFLSITASWSSGGNKTYTYDRPNRGTGGPKRPGNVNAGGGNAFVSKNYEGALVGEGADKIANTNVGYGLLAKMGWTEGMMIGKNGGINEPIVAVIKTSKAGLGSGWVRYNKGGGST